MADAADPYYLDRFAAHVAAASQRHARMHKRLVEVGADLGLSPPASLPFPFLRRLPTQRAMEIDAVLNHLRVQAADVSAALAGRGRLTPVALSLLAAVAPSPPELAAARRWPAPLSNAERFVAELAAMPFWTERMCCLAFSASFFHAARCAGGLHDRGELLARGLGDVRRAVRRMESASKGSQDLMHFCREMRVFLLEAEAHLQAR